MTCCEKMRKMDPTMMQAPSTRWQQLVVDEATRRGGFPEKVARKFFAPYWGNQDKLTLDGAAEFFGVDRHTIEHALDEITSVAARQFNASKEAQVLKNRSEERRVGKECRL